MAKRSNPPVLYVCIFVLFSISVKVSGHPSCFSVLMATIPCKNTDIKTGLSSLSSYKDLDYGKFPNAKLDNGNNVFTYSLETNNVYKWGDKGPGKGRCRTMDLGSYAGRKVSCLLICVTFI